MHARRARDERASVGRTHRDAEAGDTLPKKQGGYGAHKSDGDRRGINQLV